MNPEDIKYEPDGGLDFDSVTSITGNVFKRGSMQTINSIKSTWLMGTDMSEQELKSEFDRMDSETSKVLTPQQQEEMKAAPWYSKAALQATEMVPGIISSTGSGLAAGAAQKTFGGVAGAALTRVHPALGAAVTLGSGVPASTVATVENIREQVTGEAFKTYIQQGMSKDSARNVATAYGGVATALEYLSLRTLKGVAGSFLSQAQKDAAAAALKGNKWLQNIVKPSTDLSAPSSVADSLWKRLLEGAKGLGTEAVTESGTEAFQSMAQDVGFEAGATLDDPEVKKLIDKMYADVDPSMLVEIAAQASRKFGLRLEERKSDILDKGANTFVDTLLPSLFLGGGVAGVSYAAGAGKGISNAVQRSDAIKQLNEVLKTKTPQEIIRTALDRLHDTPEVDAPPEEANLTVKVTESGKVVAVPQLTPEEPQLEPDPAVLAAQQQPDLVGRVEAGPALEGTPLGSIEQVVTNVQEVTQGNAEAADVATTILNQAVQAVDEVNAQQGKVSDAEMQAALDVLYPETQMEEVVPDNIEGMDLSPNQDWTPMTDVEIGARLRYIDTAKRLIRQTVRGMDAEFTRREAQGKSVTRLLDKMESLLENQEGLELEQEMLEAGLLSREDMGRNEGQMRMSSLARIMDKIKTGADKLEALKQKYERKSQEQRVNEAWKTATLKQKAQMKLDKKTQESFERGRRSEARTIAWVQKQLTAAINAGTRDKNIRGQLYKAVTQAKSRQDLTAVGQQIQTQLNDLLTQKQERQETDAKIKLLDKVERLLKQGKVKMSSGRPTAKFEADTTALLGRLRGYMADSVNAQNFIDDFNIRYQNTPPQNIPTEDLHEFQLAAQLMNADQQSLLNANVLAGNIAQLIADGKSIIEAKKAAKKAELDQLVANAKDSIMPDLDERIVIDPTLKQQTQQALDTKVAQILTFDALMDYITPYDVNHRLTELLDPTQYKADFHENEANTTGLVWTSLTTALHNTGVKTPLAEYIFEASNDNWSFEYRLQTGKTKKGQISRAKALDLYMKIKDPTLHTTLRDSNKLTLTGDVNAGESFQEQLMKILRPEDIAVADAVMDFYQSYYDRINMFYREKYGVDLPKNPYYSPIERRPGDAIPTLTDRFASVMPGSSKSRVKTDKELRFSNPFSALEEHISEWEHAIASDTLAQQMRAVFSDSDIVKTIQDRHGYGTVEVIKNYIERFIDNAPIKTSRFDSIFTAMQSDISSAALGGRHIYSATVQMSSMSLIFGEYNPQQILQGIGAAGLKVIDTQKALSKSKVLDARFRQGPSFDLKNALRSGGMFGAFYNKLVGTEQLPLSLREMTAMQRILFDGLRYGDAGVARLVGGVVYNIELQNGKTHEEALRRVEQLVERTQQSAHVDQMPNFFASHPALYTLFGQFMMQPLQSVGHTVIALRDYVNVGSKTPFKMQSYKDIAKLMWQTSAYWFAPGLALAIAKTAPLWLAPPSGDDDVNEREMFFEWLKSTVGGGASAIPFFGTLMEVLWFAAAQPLIGEDKDYMQRYLGQNPFVKNFFVNPAQAMEKAVEYFRSTDSEDEPESDKTDEELTKDEMKTMQGIAKGLTAFGVPNQWVVQPFSIYTALEYADPIGAILGLGGWSTGSLNNRLDAVLRDVKEAEDLTSDIDEDADPNLYDVIKNEMEQPVQPETVIPMENPDGGI